MQFYPDDNSTPIYYENTYDDLESACQNNNGTRVKWMWEQRLVNSSDMHSAYLYCLIKRLHIMADLIDSLVHIGVKDKLYAMELAYQPKWIDPPSRRWTTDIMQF